MREATVIPAIVSTGSSKALGNAWRSTTRVSLMPRLRAAST